MNDTYLDALFFVAALSFGAGMLLSGIVVLALLVVV